MSFSNNNDNMVMPVAPMYGGGYGNGGGMFGDNGWWIILLLLCGWGGGFGMGGFGGGFGNMMLGYDFPWLLNGQQGINANTNAGFNQAATSAALGDISLGIAGVNQNICQSTGQLQNSLCQGFAGTTAAVTAAQNGITQQLYNNEIASLNRSFDAQTANAQGFNGVQAQLAQCCCDNRLATCQTQNIIQNEANATRFADASNTRDILESQNRGIQAILDKLCDQELQAERRENQNLRSELMYARGQASQVEQTAQLLANNNAQTALFQQGLNNEVDALYNRLSSCPIPSTPVFGRTPIFNCGCGNNSNGCGCGSF